MQSVQAYRMSEKSKLSDRDVIPLPSESGRGAQVKDIPE
jgi:hypothetical protein